MTDETLTLTAHQLCAVVGITYRQVDYWARIGLLRPSVSAAQGSGSIRAYSADDARVAYGIRRAIDAGLSLQRIRAALGFLRDPEGCELLYVGPGDVVGVCNVGALRDVIVECKGLLVVVDIASLDTDVARAIKRVLAEVEPAPVKSEQPGALAGTQHGSINKLDRQPAEPALTREEVMRIRA